MLAGLNALAYETKLSAKVLALEPGADTPGSVKLIGFVSLASWLAVLNCGRMLLFLGDAFYTGPRRSDSTALVRWPDAQWLPAASTISASSCEEVS